VVDGLKGKDLLTFAELDASDIDLLMRLSSKLKRTRKSFREPVMNGLTQLLIFQQSSTRTRVSFEIAMRELGGNSVALSANELQLGRGETIEDTAKVLSRYGHLLMARVKQHDDVVRLAKASSVPVINGLSDLYHPVQILADMFTLIERKGRLKGLKVAWVGDGDNMCNSWMLGAALTGVELVVAAPKAFRPSAAVLKDARRLASAGASITLVENPIEAVTSADCVMADSFVSMGFEKERENRIAAFLPKYQVNEELLSHSKKDSVFLHCLPAHRGEEATDEVMDGPRSAVFDEAENRLHSTKALLCLMLLGKQKAGSLLRR
jgi:ornithine carbamoyltransferase